MSCDLPDRWKLDDLASVTARPLVGGFGGSAEGFNEMVGGHGAAQRFVVGGYVEIDQLPGKSEPGGTCKKQLDFLLGHTQRLPSVSIRQPTEWARNFRGSPVRFGVSQ